MVRQTLTTLAPKVLAGRMVREYVERLYAPAAHAHRALTLRTARDLSIWKTQVREAWPQVAVDHVEAQFTPPAPGGAAELGSALSLRVQVRLGGLDSTDVEVQAVAGRADDGDRLTDTTAIALKPTAGPDDEGRHLYEGPLALDRTGPFGYTVRILPTHALLASPAELGLTALPSESASEAAGVLMR
jgi:starch phosphorylase